MKRGPAEVGRVTAEWGFGGVRCLSTRRRSNDLDQAECEDTGGRIAPTDCELDIVGKMDTATRLIDQAYAIAARRPHEPWIFERDGWDWRWISFADGIARIAHLADQ